MLWKRSFIRSFVLFFGFFNGLWLSLGFNPKQEVLNMIKTYLLDHHLVPQIVLTWLPIAVFVFMVGLLIYRGGWIGVLAVVLGFIAGLLVLINPVYSAMLLLSGFLLGLVAPKQRYL